MLYTALRIGLVALLLLMSGCNTRPAPITSLDQPPSLRIQVHQVAAGDTLYSIAWRYDLDYRKLARANGIREPYSIYVGQTLLLDTSKVTSMAEPVVTRKTASKPTTQSPAAPKTTYQRPPSATSTSSGKTSKQSTKPVDRSSAATVARKYNGNWEWPVKGRLLKRFSPRDLQKGITVKGLARSAVRAAAPGVVVYAGEGLRGYGKLIIIKHSDILLSAYAHNKSIMVSEGQKVKQSEVISRLADNGILYFEIRKDGKPVNPVTYLE